MQVDVVGTFMAVAVQQRHHASSGNVIHELKSKKWIHRKRMLFKERK